MIRKKRCRFSKLGGNVWHCRELVGSKRPQFESDRVALNFAAWAETWHRVEPEVGHRFVLVAVAPLLIGLVEEWVDHSRHNPGLLRLMASLGRCPVRRMGLIEKQSWG